MVLKSIKYLLIGLLATVIAILLWINYHLYFSHQEIAKKKTDIIHQLNFIGKEIKERDLGNRMQNIFPEGYVFTNALYGLAWCELAQAHFKNTDNTVKKRAVQEALYAYSNIASANAQEVFDRELQLAYGAFYFGWKNYLLSKIFLTDTTFSEYNTLKGNFIAEADSFDLHLKESATPYFESYFEQTWPADMFVAMAALSNYNQINPRYKTTVEKWLQSVKQHVDSNQLIPHQVDHANASILNEARGSSMSLILRMLAEIDKAYAQSLWINFEKKYVFDILGLPFLREFPKEKQSYSDIDSGPVVLGVGFSGTIVMIGTYAVMDQKDMSDRQYSVINAFGFKSETSNEKKYLFGGLPIADAFIVWGRASSLKCNTSEAKNDNRWKVKFHLTSLLFIMILAGTIFIIYRPK
jgi:hypothetical protein